MVRDRDRDGGEESRRNDYGRFISHCPLRIHDFNIRTDFCEDPGPGTRSFTFSGSPLWLAPALRTC